MLTGQRNNVRIFHEGKTAVSTIDIGVSFKNNSVISRKIDDSKVLTYTGTNNVFYGYKAADNFRYGSYNLCMGTDTGKELGTIITNPTMGNTFIGNFTGKTNTASKENIFIGYKCIEDTERNIQFENIIIGNHTSNEGDHNICVGNFTKTYDTEKLISIGNNNSNINANDSVIVGQSISNSGNNSAILGKNINNTGNNSYILYPNITGYSNHDDNHINIFGIMDGNKGEEFNFNENIFLKKSTKASNFEFHGDINFGVNDDSKVYFKGKDVTALFYSMSNFMVTEFDDQRFEHLIKPFPWLRQEQNLIELADFSYTNFLLDEKLLLRDWLKNNIEYLSQDTDFFVNNVWKYLFHPLPGATEPRIKQFYGSIPLLELSNNLAPWLMPNQQDVFLSGFTNDLFNNPQEIVPWLNKFQSKIMLNEFSNDLAPWLRYDQSNILLNNFSNNLVLHEDNFVNIKLSYIDNDIAPWITVYQSNIYLSNFSNNLAPWLRYDQSNVLLNNFSNNLAPWLRYDQSNVLLNNFSNNLAPWLQYDQSNVLLNNFSNNLAPWLQYDQSNVLLNNFSNNLAPWLQYDQSNVLLNNFSNNLAPWLQYDSSKIRLSRFSNDIKSQKLDSLICSNLEINGDLRILGEVHTIDTNVTLTERFAISNDGTGPALEVIQYGNTDVATFFDDDKVAMIIKDGGNIGINTINPTERLYIEGNTFISSNLFVVNTVYTSNLDSADNTMSIVGSNVNIKDILNIMDDTTYIMNEVSISSNLYVEGLIMKIPVGTSNNRPSVQNAPIGSVFYNSNTMRFEGLHDLNGVKEWLPFGGVVDIDGDTYISAEKTPNDNTLSFFTGDKDVPVAILNADMLSVSTDVYMNSKLTVKDTLYASNLQINGDLRILGEVHTIDTVITLTERFMVSNDGTGPALEVTQYGDDDIAHFKDDDNTVLIIKDGGYIGINTNDPKYELTIQGSTFISDELICSNLDSADNTMSIVGSNVNIKDILNLTDAVTYISNDVSLAKNVTIVDTLYTSNILSDNAINIDGSEVNIKGVSLSSDTFSITASNFNLANGVFYDAVREVFTISNDVVVKGNFECGTMTIQAFEERTRILDLAYSNLTDYFETENGLIANGAIFTPNENVFTNPTYFLNDIFLSSNLKIDPVFKVNVQCRCNLTLSGEFYGDPENSNGIMVKDNVTFYEPILMEKDAQLNDTLIFYDTNSNGYWKVFTDTIGKLSCDLIFQSRNNIATAFTDEFDPNIINFTGQHRCTGQFSKENKKDLVGKIVVSTGKYSDLQNERKININEAIPIVKMSSKENDSRVFGVISDEETNDMIREHHLGFIKFKSKKRIKNKKYMINSVGEGGVWVCNINGNLKNGDYITTSKIGGYGMKQGDNIHYNYTVAKITCDCDFNLNSEEYECKEFTYRNLKYRKAFVGCIYKC